MMRKYDDREKKIINEFMRYIEDFYMDFNKPIYKLKGYTRYKNSPNITANVYERNFTFF